MHFSIQYTAEHKSRIYVKINQLKNNNTVQLWGTQRRSIDTVQNNTRLKHKLNSNLHLDIQSTHFIEHLVIVRKKIYINKIEENKNKTLFKYRYRDVCGMEYKSRVWIICYSVHINFHVCICGHMWKKLRMHIFKTSITVFSCISEWVTDRALLLYTLSQYV